MAAAAAWCERSHGLVLDRNRRRHPRLKLGRAPPLRAGIPLILSTISTPQGIASPSLRSGLLGIADHDGLREVVDVANAGDERAHLALDVFVRGVSSAVAAMTASLRGLDEFVFSAGAGERSALLRAAVCARLGQLGVALDGERNTRHAQQIAAPGARVAVLVVHAGEEFVIARDTARVVRGN
jgi:acetate kinase